MKKINLSGKMNSPSIPVFHLNNSNSSLLRRKASGDESISSEIPPIVNEVLKSPGQSLDRESRSFFESRFSNDFSSVRVHTDARAAESAQAVNAHAYAVGRNIVFGAGEYAPKTRSGRQLLAHELAHVAHHDIVGVTNPGIAPPNSLAERQAHDTAKRMVNEPTASPERHSPQTLRSWGSAWQIHPEKIVTRGSSVHSGQVGGPPPGMAGPPIGNVEVRTGEEIELPGGARIPNTIALEYTGSLTADSKWLQFVWFEMTALTPSGTARLSGSIPTSSGTKPFTTSPTSPSWTVDSATSNPFYEGGGASIRTASSTTMFDAPGGSSVAPLASSVFRGGIGATSVTFTAHFDTYLIQNNLTQYHVPWSASTSFTQSGQNVVAAAIGYTVSGSGAVTQLPTNLRTILHTAYPGHRSVQ